MKIKEKEELHKRVLQEKYEDITTKKIKTEDDSETETETDSNNTNTNNNNNNMTTISNNRNSNDNDTERDTEKGKDTSEKYDLYLESLKGRNSKLKDNAKYVEYLKKEARRKYLIEREKEQLEITKKLLDDELLYSTIKLEGKEKKELELSKKIYDIAKENIELRETIKEEEYTFQEETEDSFQKKLKSVKEELQDTGTYDYDQQIIKKGILKFGSKLTQEEINANESFVFDDTCSSSSETASGKGIKRGREKELVEETKKHKQKKTHKHETHKRGEDTSEEEQEEREEQEEKEKEKEKEHGHKRKTEYTEKERDKQTGKEKDKYKDKPTGRELDVGKDRYNDKYREKERDKDKEKRKSRELTEEDVEEDSKRKRKKKHDNVIKSEKEESTTLSKNGLKNTIKFVHLDKLYGANEKEKELQKVVEDIKRKKEKKMKKIIDDRKKLPIYSYRYDILKAIKNNKVLVLVGETGSGKSTQLAQYLYECKYHLYGNIICTQPRRIACIAIANRVADEMNIKLGKEVGYVIRFQNKTSDATKIIYMTDGMFLRLLLYNPTLDDVSVLIIDEAHERSLHTDIIFPIVKDLCTFKENIRVVISSATLDAEKISSYFNCAPIFYVPGRKYNVDIYYTINSESNYLSAIVITILQIHITQPKGDILVFLPGQFEIDIVQHELENKLNELSPKFRNLLILPIYSSLPVEQQSRIFEDIDEDIPTQEEEAKENNVGKEKRESADMKGVTKERKELTTAIEEETSNTKDTSEKNPPNMETNQLVPPKKNREQEKRLSRQRLRRKIILSTNICETSITIENIVYVIDSGLCKQKIYNPNSGVESLVTLPCSKASVNQRTGRAGRRQEGKCFRLFTKKAYIDLTDNCVPEIQRCEVSSMILLLKSLGMDDIINFDFLDPPSPIVIIKGLELLYSLGALNDEGTLTKTGRQMAEFPTDVKSSKMIISAAEKYKCVEEVLCITSMLTHANNIFYFQKGKEKEAENMKKVFTIEGGGDYFLFLNIYKQCEQNHFSTSFCYDHFLQYHTLLKVKDVKQQLANICEKIDLKITSTDIQTYQGISNIKKCIISAFFTNAAIPVSKNELKIIKLNQIVSIYPNSVLKKKDLQENKKLCVIFYEVIKINKSYIRHNIAVDKDLLYEIASFYFKTDKININIKHPKKTEPLQIDKT